MFECASSSWLWYVQVYLVTWLPKSKVGKRYVDATSTRDQLGNQHPQLQLAITGSWKTIIPCRDIRENYPWQEPKQQRLPPFHRFFGVPDLSLKLWTKPTSSSFPQDVSWSSGSTESLHSFDGLAEVGRTKLAVMGIYSPPKKFLALTKIVFFGWMLALVVC